MVHRDRGPDAAAFGPQSPYTIAPEVSVTVMIATEAIGEGPAW